MKALLCGLVLLAGSLAEAQTNTPKFSIISNNPVVMDKLYSVQSDCLMTNAEFRTAFGERLIFKSGLRLEMYHYYDLHPSVLTALSLDVGAMKQAQADMDAKNKKWAENQALGSQAILAQRQAFIDVQAKIEAERKAQEAIARRQAFEDSLRIQAVVNDTTRANAAAKQADAYSTAVSNPQAAQPAAINQTTVVVRP